MQAIERLETEITPDVIVTGLNNLHKEVLYEIFYEGHKRRAAIQGLRKKGLRREWNMKLEMMAKEYNPN